VPRAALDLVEADERDAASAERLALQPEPISTVNDSNLSPHFRHPERTLDLQAYYRELLYFGSLGILPQCFRPVYVKSCINIFTFFRWEHRVGACGQKLQKAVVEAFTTALITTTLRFEGKAADVMIAAVRFAVVRMDDYMYVIAELSPPYHTSDQSLGNFLVDPPENGSTALWADTPQASVRRHWPRCSQPSES